MTAFADRPPISRGQPVATHRPWPRDIIEVPQWRWATDELAAGRTTLLGLWGEPDAVHMTLLEEASGNISVLTLPCPARRFPSVGQLHAPAIRLERTIADLFGLIPQSTPDRRPWLDHGRWGVRHPFRNPPDRAAGPTAYPFLPAEGEGLHQIPVGPVHAGIIEPGHFRFTANGETVVRLEERLGYVHKGVERLMAGQTIAQGAKLAGRVSGDSTVAYALAFARAVEAALDVTVPPRAVWLRAVMAELERIANHLGDIGAVCNDAAFALMHAHCGVLRERVLRAASAAFGHRLMMDGIVPGGVARDIAPAGERAIRTLLKTLAARFPPLIELYDNTASLQDRTVGTGVLSPELARTFGAGGYVGRGSGRAFDARRHPGYPPYDQLSFKVPLRKDGDVNARVWIRIREVQQSLGLLGQLLDGLPGGPAVCGELALPSTGGEGSALIEGFRGDILVFVRITSAGAIARCHLRDPSWFQWPLLEAAIEGNIVADFPLCNKSFNCSYSGHDL